MTPKAVRILERIQAHTGGEIRTSARGVPHLVVTDKGGLSAVYFCRTRTVRVFSNYASGQQCRWNFKQWPEAADFINARKDMHPMAHALARVLQKAAAV